MASAPATDPADLRRHATEATAAARACYR